MLGVHKRSHKNHSQNHTGDLEIRPRQPDVLHRCSEKEERGTIFALIFIGTPRRRDQHGRRLAPCLPELAAEGTGRSPDALSGPPPPWVRTHGWSLRDTQHRDTKLKKKRETAAGGGCRNCGRKATTLRRLLRVASRRLLAVPDGGKQGRRLAQASLQAFTAALPRMGWGRIGAAPFRQSR
ncbi:hypothetical protein ISCGN_008549 [Ixodes scapularis]